MKSDKLRNILNKISSRVDPDGSPYPSSPVKPGPDTGACCSPGGSCQYIFIDSPEARACEEDDTSEFIPYGFCPDSCDFGDDGGAFEQGLCVNCATERCSLITDCDHEGRDECVRSGGKVYCAEDFDDFVLPSCQELIDIGCYGDPDSGPGACCMVATQPAPGFFLGCINVDNAQVCSDIQQQSGGIINTNFQEGKKCGQMGAGQDPDGDVYADCPLASEEMLKNPAACCKTCYSYNEYNEQTVVSKTCRHTKKFRCLSRNWIDEDGNPGPYHPDFDRNRRFHCVHTWGGDNTVCKNSIGAPNGYPELPKGYKPYCDGDWNRENDDSYYEDDPYPWVE